MLVIFDKLQLYGYMSVVFILQHPLSAFNQLVDSLKWKSTTTSVTTWSTSWGSGRLSDIWLIADITERLINSNRWFSKLLFQLKALKFRIIEE